MTPLAFVGCEFLTLGWRCDMTGKFWALIFAAAWIVFLPEIARQKAWPYRAIFGLIVLNGILSVCFWTTFYSRTLERAESATSRGWANFVSTRTRLESWETVSRLDNQIIIPGRDQEHSTRTRC